MTELNDDKITEKPECIEVQVIPKTESDPEWCEGERETSRSEVWGFYGCFVGKSPIEVLSALIAPIAIQKLATIAAVREDGKTPCDPKIPNLPCFVNVGGWRLNVLSYTLFVAGIGILVQCIVLVQVGPLVDRGNNKRWTILAACSIGFASCCMFLVGDRPHLYWLAALGSILLNLCYALYTSALYAYIPILARNRPECRTLEISDPRERDETKSRMMNHLLIRAGVAGQVLATLVCVLSVIVTLYLVPGVMGMGISMALGGGVWLICGSVGIHRLANRPGPQSTGAREMLFLGWRQLGIFLTRCRALSNLCLTLFSFLLYVDACKLLVTVPQIIAQDELKVAPVTAFAIAAFVPLLEAIGIQISFYILKYFKKKFNITKLSLLGLLGIHSLLSIYLVLGIYTKIGIHTEWELYVYSGIISIIIGPTFNFYFVIYTDLIPKGHESFFSGIQQIFGRGSSWLGPIFVGIMANGGVSIRNSFWLTQGMLLMSIVLLAICNIPKGRIQAKEFKF